MPRFVDLSHIVADGMITYPGLPGPRISDHLSREESRHHYESGTEFHIGRIEMVANTARIWTLRSIASPTVTTSSACPSIVWRKWKAWWSACSSGKRRR